MAEAKTIDLIDVTEDKTVATETSGACACGGCGCS